jgi:hypothetical protein
MVKSKATWKIERWGDVETTLEDLGRKYDSLSFREMVIVGVAAIDVALAELLAMRLLDDPPEAYDFLGADGDGRAPAGSFGARIQLAYLLGLIAKPSISILRALKAVRNAMAHRIQASVVGSTLDALRAAMMNEAEADPPPEGYLKFITELCEKSRTDEKAARSLVFLGLAAATVALLEIRKYATHLPLVLVDTEEIEKKARGGGAGD